MGGCGRRGVNEHREIQVTLQLSQEIEIEKPGEFREACFPLGNGNPERSINLLWVDERAETRPQGRTSLYSEGSARHLRSVNSEYGEEIVRA